MKNLGMILAALSSISRPIRVDIYGPIEDRRHWVTCQELIAQIPPHVRVRYLGELAPAQVRATFAGYDFFVFPTLGENFGTSSPRASPRPAPWCCPTRHSSTSQPSRRAVASSSRTSVSLPWPA